MMMRGEKKRLMVDLSIVERIPDLYAVIPEHLVIEISFIPVSTAYIISRSSLRLWCYHRL